MDVSRLLAVVNDVEIEYKADLSKLLSTFIQQYTIARDSPTVDNAPAIQKAFSALVKCVDEGVFPQYPPSKTAVLNAIGGDQRVGLGFRERLSTLLSVSGQTTAGIVTGLTSLQADLDTFRKACTQAKAGLEALGLSPHAIPEGQFEVGVLIPEGLVDHKLSTLVKELSAWNKIVRGFQEVAGDDEREVTITGLASGSYEIYLPLGIIAADLLSRTIDKVLEWYLKVLEIRKHRLELKELGAPVAEVAAIQKHEKDIVESGILALAKDLVKEVHPKIDADRRNELETHLTISIRQIARFVDRGGTVEVDSAAPVEPAEPAAPEGEAVTPEQKQEHDRLKSEFKNLRLQFEKVSQILNAGSSLRQLPERSEPILQISEEESNEDSILAEKPPKKK